MAATGFTPIQIYYSTTASAVPTAGNLLPGELALNIADMKLYCENSSGVVTLLASATGASGDVVGPASSTDNAVVRFDGTTGKLVQDSAVTIADDGATVISTNSTTDSLRITQTGTGNALVIEDSANPDSTPFVVNASGQLLLGNTTTWPTGGGVAIALTSESGSNPNGNIASRRYATDADATTFTQAKARGTLASPTVVADSDALGTLQWQGYDGTTFLNCARIRAEVDGTPGTNDMPGRLVFFITPDGSTTLTERMRISSAGVVTITGTGIINASSSSDALRITQTGAGNALVIEDSANPDSSPVVVDTNGTVLVGDTVSRTIAGVTTSRLQVASESSNGFQAGLSAIAWDADAPGSILSAPVISMSRSASDTTGTQAAVSQNQFLGTINFSGSDGTQFVPAAQIVCGVDGTVGTNDMPGRLVFSTTADGASTPTERLRIASTGAIGLSGANYGSAGQVLTSNGSSSPPTWAAASAGGISYTRVTSATTLSSQQGVIADTTGGSFTVNLPATPTTGDQVFIADGGDWATNNLTVGRNGSTIEGVAANWTLNQGGAEAQFIYDGTTWQLYTQYGPEFNGTLKSYKETVVTVTANTASTNLDLRQGNIFNVTISSNTTFTFINPPTSGVLQSATVIVKQDGVGGRTGTFTSSKWTDGIAPTLTTTANRTDVFTFFTVDGGTSYFGTYALANVA